VFSIARRNETRCSTRCDGIHQELHGSKTTTTQPASMQQQVGGPSALVRVVFHVSGFCHSFPLEAWTGFAKQRQSRCAGSLAAEAPGLVRLALPHNARRHGAAPTLQMRFLSYQRRMALSTPRINSRGCRQPCTALVFLLAELRPEFYLFLGRRSEVSGRLQISSSVPGFSASKSRAGAKFHSRSPEKSGQENPKHRRHAQASCRPVT